MQTPYYRVNAAKIRQNCQLLRSVMDRAGCDILLAQKAFSCYPLYPLIGEYLSGAASSGLFESRLARQHFPGESHVFCTAFRPEDFPAILDFSDKLIFNSPAQLLAYGPLAKERSISVGLRLNPEHSTQDGSGIYDPCAPGSRLGTTRAALDAYDLQTILPLLDGVHFHTLCEQDAAPLLETVSALEKNFSDILPHMQWINLGGGHHITRAGYDIEGLVQCVRRLSSQYDVRVYLEPGEAIALDAGELVTTVLDIVQNGDTQIAILDASAACHMPDVLEMPYRAPLVGSDMPNKLPYTYRLAGPTCLAGDVIGDYSFAKPLKVGDQLEFTDMAIYTMVKNNTFNGMPLPAIVLDEGGGKQTVLKQFGYEDFKNRLG